MTAEWMQKHNRLQSTVRQGVAEAEELRQEAFEQGRELRQTRDLYEACKARVGELEQGSQDLEEVVARQGEEIRQLTTLYETERTAASTLEKALSKEKDNFERLMSSLEAERTRSRLAGDRDSDTITDLRNALEVERELRHSGASALNPTATSATTAGNTFSCSSPMLGTRARLFEPAVPAEVDQEDIAGPGQVPEDQRSAWNNKLEAKFQEACRALETEKGRVDSLKECLEEEQRRARDLEIQLSAIRRKSSDPTNDAQPSGGGGSSSSFRHQQRRRASMMIPSTENIFSCDNSSGASVHRRRLSLATSPFAPHQFGGIVAAAAAGYHQQISSSR